MSKQWWREFWWALTHSGPYSDYARGLGDREANRHSVEAATLRGCAATVETWLGCIYQEPDYVSLGQIVEGWRADAERLSPKGQEQR